MTSKQSFTVRSLDLHDCVKKEVVVGEQTGHSPIGGGKLISNLRLIVPLLCWFPEFLLADSLSKSRDQPTATGSSA